MLGSIAALALIATACGGGGSSKTSSPSTTSGTSSGGTSSSTLPNQKSAVNNTGTPVKGGVLTMLGTGDVDYMDPNVSYYSIGYLGLRMWSRQLYTYPAVEGKTTTIVPDLATGMPKITNGGKTYSVTIRKGAMWNTTPPRQVTAADVVRGVKRTCNPTQPFGGQPDFQNLIAGYNTFCQGFSKVSTTDAAAQKAYIDANNISGVSVDQSDPQTVVFTLTQPTSYFTNILAMPAFSPAPVEFLNYLPASNALAQHTISDGPYEIKSYNPGKSIDFVRNPAWQASSDPVRKAYVNEIKVSETGNQQSIEQQIETNTPQADMEWDSFVPQSDIPRLLNDPRLTLQSEYSSNPYVIFNTVSPNNNGALAKVQVRQALEYALNRTNLIQDNGGPNVAPPLTQILPPGISGSTPAVGDMYPYDPTKAKSMLASAGYPNGLSLKFLYRPASQLSSSMFQTIQADLAKAGIKVTGVGVPNADFYTKYLEVPSVAKAGTWDLSLAGWSPDWYGNAAASFFNPLFAGQPSFPPVGSNFGFFNDPTVNSLIAKANAAPTESESSTLWHQADVQTMKDAAIFPITDPNQATMHGNQVHNAIYMAVYEQIDPTNVWLSNG